MPVQLNIRTQINARANTKAFGDALDQQMTTGLPNGKEKIKELRDYLEGKANDAKIRVVNTTKNKELSLRVKSWGHGPAYRKERTAETIKRLLSQAGVPAEVANAVVDRVLKPDGIQKTATAGLIKQILIDAEIILALNGPSGVASEPSEKKLIQADPIIQPDKQGSAVTSPFKQLLEEFKNPALHPVYLLDIEQGKHPLVFEHKSGRRAEIRNLRQDNALVSPGPEKIVNERDLYSEFNKRHRPIDNPEGPPDKYLLQEWENGKSKGDPLLLTRDEFMGKEALHGKTFKVLATLKFEAPAKEEEGQGLEPTLANKKALIETGLIEPGLIQPGPEEQDLENPPQLGQPPQSRPPKTYTVKPKLGVPFDLSMDAFLINQGFKPGRELGKGSFGVVKLAGVGNDDASCVAKYFRNEKNAALPDPVLLSFNRDVGQKNEAYAAYLAKKSDDPPKVIAPTHYIVGRPNAKDPDAIDMELVPTEQLKATVKEYHKKTGNGLSCYGLMMAKAPGQEVTKQLTNLSHDPRARAQMAKSGLESLRSLNKRGFIHRDIKPDNMLFDGKDVSFIDTGFLFKVQKTDADRDNTLDNVGDRQAQALRKQKLPTLVAGTLLYLHPNVFYQKNLGTQADLHALGLVMLQSESPKVFKEFFPKRFTQGRDSHTPFLLTPKEIKTRIDKIIANSKDDEVIRAARALKGNIEVPNHPAHLAMLCLTKADTTQPGLDALRWANRKFSDDQYQELLNHPSLRLAAAGAVA